MASWVTIVLPGRGYGAHGPAIRLPVLALEAAGAATAVIDYPAGLTGDEHGPALVAAVEQRIRIAMAGAARVTLVAKSLGTALLAALVPRLPEAAEVEAVWITPLFGDEGVRAAATDSGWRSLLVAGGADPFHHPAAHQTVAETTGAASLVIPGADHALEVAGQPGATVEGLRQLTEATSAFALHREAPADSRSVVSRFYDAFRTDDHERRLRLLLSDDVTWHVAGDSPLAGTFRGPDEVLAAMRRNAEHSSGTLHLDAHSLLGDGEHVVAVHAATAERSGLRYATQDITVLRVRAGRIVQLWSFSED